MARETDRSVAPEPPGREWEEAPVPRSTSPSVRRGSGVGRGLHSTHAVCLWIPHYPLRCELERRPELEDRPSAVLAPEDSRRIWQASTRARHEGIKAGMTVSQAIGMCPALALIEPDPVYYDERFAQLLLRLENVSPVIEPAELGRVYVGVDGLERLVGGPEGQLAAVERLSGWTVENQTPTAQPPNRPTARLGWARGKFTAWVAATRAKPGQPVVVDDRERVPFLHTQPVAVLPLHPDNHRRLTQLGIRTLGDLAALPEAAVITQFGREGRAAWRLASGVLDEPVHGRERPQPITVSLDFPAPVGDRGMLAHAVSVLIEHALRDHRRTGWRVQTARVRAALEHGGSWLVQTVLKDPSAIRERIAAPLLTKLEQTPPVGAVEQLTVEFTAFARGTDELQLFARDAGAAARAGRRGALRAAAREIQSRLKRHMLYRIVEVQPWSRLPERRYALIAFEP